MTWTTPADLRRQVRRLWERGAMLASLAGGKRLFPRKMRLKGPSAREVGERFAEVRDWIADLRAGAGRYRIVWRRVNHRVLGANDLPAEVWIDTLDDALALIGETGAAARFADLVETTGARLPKALPWLARHPMQALELAEEWPLLLDIAAWLRDHPRPGIYPRRLDLPGVHTKLIERRRGVLTGLFDLVLPADAVDRSHTGVGGFNRRYGFLDRPVMVRFRILDPAAAFLPAVCGRDITVTAESFAALDAPVSRVFVTENEINFLAFPDTADALVIFGRGYGVLPALAGAAWLRDRRLFYWGDIDTHGFAILDRFRKLFPHAESLLMDQSTLLAHRRLWGREDRQATAPLARLRPGENELYDKLRRNVLGDRVRLEQERVGFAFLEEALARTRG